MHRSLRSTHRHSSDPRCGSALVVALLTVMSVTVIGAGFLRVTSSIMRRHEAAVHTKQSFYLAEAGLAEAWAGVLLGKTGVVGSQAMPAKMGDGVFWVETTDNPDGTRTLESTGLCGGGRATLQAVVGWPSSIANENTILTEEPLIVPEGALIDAYDPPAEGVGGGGPGGLLGDPAPADSKVRLQSNGSITILGSPSSPATILGDLAPGPGESAVVDPDSTLSGGVFPAPELETLAPVDVPNVTLGTGVIHSGPVPYVLPTGLIGYDHLRVEANSQMIITGPAVVVMGELTVDAGAELVLDASQGEIQLFVTNQLLFQRGASVMTVEDDSTQLSVQVDGDVPVDLNAASEFHGMLHAPQARVQVGSPFQLFGSIAARRLDLAPGVQLHFDQRVVAAAQNGIVPRFIGWRVEALPQGVRSGVGMDPFKGLNLDPAALPMPYQAHKDQTIDVVYLDVGLLPQTYSGLESAFDWNSVTLVLKMQRDGTDTAPAIIHDDSALSKDGSFLVRLP